jgi:hypothetical protein
MIMLILLFVQTLFPGAWLSEVNADSYKVPDPPKNGKVCMCMSIFLFLFLN